jgi:hypothetical protein
MKLPPVYKNIDEIKWIEPEEFKNEHINTDEKINKKEYSNYYKIGIYHKQNVIYDIGVVGEEISYIWFNDKTKKIYLQLADYYKKELWITIDYENNPSMFRNELNRINNIYFKKKDLSEHKNIKNKAKYIKNKIKEQLEHNYNYNLKDGEKEEYYYLGLVPELKTLEENLLVGDPFTQGEFIRCGSNIQGKNETNKLTVIETKFSHTKIEAYYFDIVRVNNLSPCYFRIVYKSDTIPHDALGTLSLFNCRKFEDFKKETIKNGTDIDWSILLPALVIFDSDFFLEKINEEDFLNNKPETNKLLSIIIDLLN